MVLYVNIGMQDRHQELLVIEGKVCYSVHLFCRGISFVVYKGANNAPEKKKNERKTKKSNAEGFVTTGDSKYPRCNLCPPVCRLITYAEQRSAPIAVIKRGLQVLIFHRCQQDANTNVTSWSVCNYSPDANWYCTR